MKNLLGLLLMAAIIGFTSCSEDDDDDAIGPSISFFGGDFIDADYTATPGETLQFSWLATQGDAKLESFSVTRDGVTLQDYVEPDIPKDNYQDTLTTDAPLNEGSYKYEFTVTDKDGVSDSKNFTITVEASSSGTAISTFTSITLGDISWNTTTDGYLDVSTGTTYAEDASGAENSDLGYLFGNTYPKCIFAPDFSEVQGLNQGPSGFSTQRATRFSTTTLSASDFDAIGASLDSDDVIESNVSSPSATYIKDLSTGDVIGFVTADDNKGLIKVVTIGGTQGETDNTITIDVKVQQ